ncbi:Eco57I restriction-modification methylase domain-containing protein [Candidatus Lokiarchaeum ossiferum]|uniref:Eco57I restriction-modification methylase domain-containing protein n=1 Tax=Candidatus Lokiarchaeum ossiferum TaxID=2951803 RepID=UPI00352DC74F
MPKNSNSLFIPKIIANYIKTIDLSTDSINKLNDNVLSLKESLITMGKPSGNEENVRVKVIVPVLEFLGFDIAKDIDFESSSKSKGSTSKSIDVLIKSSNNGKIPKGLIEIKYWKKNLDEYREGKNNRYRSDVQQGLIYAIENGIQWFIITNGFQWRLYKTHITGHIVYNFYEQFDLNSLKNIQELQKFYLLLSKKSFKENIQDHLFSETELEKEKLNDEIYDILTNCRSKLFKNVLPKNKDILDEKTLLEKGQKLLDRLMFIRFAEDNQLFPKKILRELVDQWRNLASSIKKASPLYIHIKFLFDSIFSGSDEDNIFHYNGGLFEEDKLLEKIVIDDGILLEVVDSFYIYPDGKYIDFSEIPVDILGHIYEKYLGLSLKIKEEGIDLILKEKVTRKKRKATGIYYTPKYIVNHIIENTILKKLDEDLENLRNIKILDPACGSGAFLSSAYDNLFHYYQEYNEIVQRKGLTKETTKANLSPKAKKEKKLDGSYLDLFALGKEMEKYTTEFNKKILSDNLFGVDLNPESVEITKMSLWFKTAQKDVELNSLDHQIKCGNSLISEKKSSSQPFEWEKEFKEIFDNKGFDIIIGNPPYGAEINKVEKEFYEDNYELSKGYKNTAILFIEKSMNLLKEGGLLGFVLPKSLTFSQRWNPTREFLLSKCQILEIADLGEAFEGVLLEQILIICQKKPRSNLTFNGVDIIDPTKEKQYSIPFSLCQELDCIPIHVNEYALSIYRKVMQHGLKFHNITKTFRGFPKKGFVTESNTGNCEKILHGALIKPYFIKESKYYAIKNSPQLAKEKEKLLRLPKLITQRIVAHVRTPIDHLYIMSTLDLDGRLNIDTIENTIITDEIYDIRYVLAFLNSKFIAWYTYYFIFNKAVRTMDFDNYYIGKNPIYPANAEKQAVFVKLVDSMIDLTNKYSENQIDFMDEINSYPRNGNVKFEKYYQKIKTKDREILIQSSMKGKINGLNLIESNKGISFWCQIEDKEVMKKEENIINLTIEDQNLRKFLLHAFNSTNHKFKRGNILKSILDVSIPEFLSDYNQNKIKINTFMSDFLLKYDSQEKIKTEIRDNENKINQNIYNLYNLSEEEQIFIEESIGVDSVVLHLLSK